MKTLTRLVGVGALVLSLAGCPKEQTVDLTGTVTGESKSWNSYSFAIETEYGRKSVQLSSTMSTTTLESVDVLINKGDKITFPISKEKINSNVLYMSTTDFLETVKIN